MIQCQYCKSEFKSRNGLYLHQKRCHELIAIRNYQRGLEDSKIQYEQRIEQLEKQLEKEREKKTIHIDTVNNIQINNINILGLQTLFNNVLEYGKSFITVQKETGADSKTAVNRYLRHLENHVDEDVRILSRLIKDRNVAKEIYKEPESQNFIVCAVDNLVKDIYTFTNN